MPLINLKGLNNNQFALNKEQIDQKVARNAAAFSAASKADSSNQNSKWYAGDTPTWRESIGRAYEIAESDLDRGQKAYNDLQYLKNDPNSRYYRYYASATNGAIQNLENLGFDTRLLQQEGFFDAPETRSFINNNLERSGTSNSPKSPTKKTSTNGRISYWLTQYQAAMEDTQNAKAEVEKITNKAKTLAGWKDRNYSDDEIMNIIYGKEGEKFKNDYPTLYRMQNRENEFNPVELNEAVDFTQDLLYGATWLGRNADYDGKVDLEQAMAMSYMGRGNVWNANPEIALKINPLNADGVTINKDYAPYSVGSSNLDNAVVHFNTYSFTDDWIAQNQHLLYDGTEEEKKLMKQIVEGNQNYHSATEALDALSVWEKKKLSKETDPAEAKSKLDALLEKGYLYIGTGKNEGKIFSESGKDRKKVDLGILNKMDLTMGKGDSLPTADLLPMSQGVDYKYDNYVSHLNDLCSQNASVPNETSTVNDIAKETSAPYAALKAPAKAKGAELPENMPEAAQAPAAAAGITPITEAEQEQIEAQNRKIREAADLTEGIASDNETAVMRNSGSVAFNRVKESFGTMRTFPALVEGFSKTAINMGTTDVLNESLDSVHDISEYMTVQSNYESDSATYAEYEAKYGPVEYLMKPFEKEKTVQVGDFNVSMEYLFSGTENNRPGYVITNIAAPERGGGLFYDDIVSYAESGIEWAIDAMQEAEKAAKAESSEAFKILEAQNNMLGQKNGEKEVEEYKNLVPKIQREKEYLDSNEAKNKEQQAVIQKSVEKLNMMYEAATLLGQDTTQIDKAFDFLESMVQFHDEPQLPVQEMGKLEYIDEIGKTYGKQFTMHEKRKMIHDSLDSIDQQIQRIEDNIAYADETGYQIPGQYEQNMQYTLNDLKMERKAFEYAAILTDTDPDELRAAYEAGKAFEKKYAKDMVAWQGAFGTEDSPEYYYTLGEKQTAVANDDHTEYKFITNDDRTVYYYLLGKKVQELGGELDRLWEGQTGNKSTAEIRDAVTEILKDADAFVEYMNDKDYGIWTTKRAKNAGQMGRDLVESGPLGGVAANLASTAISPLENLVNIGYTIDQAITGGRFNPNAPSRLASLFKQETREATTESIEKAYADKPVAKWLAKLGYEVYSNHGDSVMNAMFTGMFMPDIANPILNELIGSMPMGFSAGVNAAMEAVENGANTDQAWFILGTTVMAETVSEAVTRSNIMEALGETGELTKETIKNAAIDWLTRSGIEEMIGETATDVFENWCNEKAADWFDNPNFESEHQKLIDYYIANGAANREEAEAKAWEQEIKGFVHTAFVSYVSAGTDVLIKTGKAAVNTVRNSADIVNGYRVYTKGRQKLGYNTSMFGYMAQDLKTAMNKNTASGQETARQAASGQEASVAVPANEEQDESAKQAATDVLAIGRVQKSNATTQTEMVASILDNGDGGETASEQANAAATFLNNVFGEDTSYIVQQCVMGTVKSGISRDVVTTALQNAAMGNGAATAIVQSESFLQATPEQKAQMLADTVEADQGNPDVQQSIADHVKDYRMGTGISELAAQGHFDQAQADQDAADRAAAETTKADAQLEEKQEMLEAATKDLQQKSEDVNRDASDDNTKQQADAATRVSSADESVRQYEQHKEKAEAVQKEAEAKAAKSKQDAMTSARETVGQNMEAVDQQRTEAAQQKAEADRIAAQEQAEAARQAQAEEDERTGKADEDRRAALIEQLLDNEKLQGEERNERREKLMNQLDKVKVKITDLKQSVSNTEGRLALYAFERKLGIPIQFADLGPVDSQRITRGKYENGTIYLNENLIKAGKMTVGQALVEASLHEIIHSVRNTNSYNSYRNVVMGALYGANNSRDAISLYQNNSNYRAAIDTMIADRAAAGDPNFTGDDLNRMIELADEEIVADFARINLAEKDVVQRLMDAGMGGRMRNTLHNINQALKNYFGNMTGEERKTAETLRRAERNLQKAINEAAETSVHPEGGQFSISQFAQSAGLNFNQDTLVLTDQNGNVIDGVNNKVTADMMNNTPVGMLIDLARDGAKTRDGKDKFTSTISPETAQAQKQMFADLMNMVAQYKDSDLVWEIASSTMFSALKSNSDPQYSTTVDFGTVCAKTQEIINVMSQVMLEKGRGLTREEVLKVYNETANANLTVPCPVCYVFSRWMGVPSLLNQMSQYQKRFVALNDDGSINMEKTGENANTYIKSALEKYGSKDKIDDAKVSLVNRMKTQEKNRTAALNVLNSETATAEEKAKAQTKHDEAIKNLDNLQKELGEVEAYNWVTQALCLQQQKGKTKYNVLDKNGNYVIDPSFELTPDNVLFDLRQTGEFAKYTKNWQYRNTRGAGMGKAIMPYSGESIGDIVYGTTRKSEIQNPFLTQTYAKAADGIKNAINRAKQQNLIGGQRLQSTSDFRPEWGLDYMMAFLELQAVGSKVQMYTKVAEAVDLLASMGGDINLSIMGKGQGWHVDENGNQVLDFSDVTGMNYETAKALKDQYDNVQMILVGMNDTHIKLALANPDIDFVIPWHSSGNSKDTLASLVSSASQGEEQLETSSDYTDTQSDKESENQTEDQKKLWNLRMKILQGQKLTEADRQIILADDYLKPLYERFTVKGKDDDCYKVKLAKDQAKQIFPYEYWNKNLTKDQANANGQAFIDYCQHFGIVPRFSGVVKTNDDGTFSVTGNFAGAIYDENGNITGYDPNQMYDGYWKVLIDRPMYTNNIMNDDGTVKEYGKYRDQQVVDVTKAKIGALENGKLTNSDMPLKTSAMYGPNYSTQEKTAVDNSLAAIEQMEQARMNGGKQSVMGDLTAADQDLMTDAVNDYADAVAREDMEAAQEDVDFYAEQKGYTIKVYHGTPNSGRFNIFDASKLNNSKLSSQIGQGFYFTNSKSGAMEYTLNMDAYGRASTGKNPYLFEGYLKLQNPIELTEDSHNLTYDQIHNIIADGNNQWFFNSGLAHDYSGETVDGKKYTEEEINSMTREEKTDFATRVLMEHGDKYSLQHLVDFYSYGKQGDLLNAMKKHTGNDGIHWQMKNGIDQYVVFDSSQFKDSAPVTYDDNGNVIPLDQRFTDSPDIRYSTEGELTEADRDLMAENEERELNQYMVDRGIITPEELAAYQEKTGSRPLEGQNPTMSTAQGPAQRAFGDADGMLRNSDEIAGFAKAVVEAQNSYFPDTNNEQVHRAINWIRSLKQTPNSDGFAEAVNAVTKDDFDYRSADGQARMVAVMGMAVARNDTMAQVALADAFNRQGTDLGRALQARKLFKLMTPAGRISTLRKMIDNYNVDLKKNGDKEITFSHWIYEAAADAETSEDFHKVLETAAAELAAQLPISWKERLNSLRMLSMLANPRTHIRNIVGNALFVPAVGMKNKIGALLEKAFVKKGERTKTLAPVLNSEIREFARQDARTMKNTLTGEAKYDENTLVQQAKNPLGPVLGVLSDVNSRFLEGEDWLFLRGHYRRALGGWMQANGYTVDQVKNDKALLEKGREYAIQEAQKATYRDFNGVAQKLNQIARDAKTPGQKALAFGINAVLPFKKTPANILKRGIEYSPLGVARSVYNLGKKFRGGDVSATQVIDQFTSGLSGTAVMALGFLLAGTGAVSCGFDDDDWPEELKGKQKYSINPNAVLESLGIPRLFGEDVTYTMDWAAPMAMPFFVGASIRSQTDQEGWDANKVFDAMSSISEPVFNLSMLDGVNSLFKINSYSNQNPATQIGAKIVSNYMSSYVPSVFGAIARTLDDTQRKSYVKKEDKKFLDGVFNYAWETAENKIPGQSQNNIPVRDVWGNAKTSDLAERIIENWISPGYIEHIQDDSVVNELGRLFDSTHSKYLVPEHADQTIDGKGLEAEVYDTYDRVHGETQYSMLKELFDSKEYQDMTNDDAKVEMVRNIYSYAKQVARGAIDEDYWYEKQAVSEMIQDGKTTDYKAKMMQCIEDGNWESYENYVEALREEGVEDSSIKSKINSKYSGQWKDAYRKYLETGNEKYSDRMAEIEELLESTGYEFNIYGNKGWEEKVDQEFQ